MIFRIYPEKKAKSFVGGLIIFSYFISPLDGLGANYFGRIMTGGYSSLETSKVPNDSSTSNNAATLSARFYLNVYDLTPKKMGVTVDLRDKNDYFEKLDQQLLQLRPGNNFQVYQLNAHLLNNEDLVYATIGRFSMLDVGGEFVDGGEVGIRWSPVLRSSIFGGLEPKRYDQTYLTFNSNSRVFGTYAVYQPVSGTWQKRTSWSTAVVGENVESHLDRLFWYNNFIYQWDRSNQIFGIAYFDFTPSFYLQFGLLSYFQQITDNFSSRLNLTGIDVIEYARRQGVLETLPSSPYREAALNLRSTMSRGAFFENNFIYGARQADHLIRAEYTAGPSFYSLMDNHLSLGGVVGVRRNFIANEALSQFKIAYFSRDWELELNVNYVLSVNNFAATYHKWINDLSVMHFFTRDFMGALSFQEAHDENVQIWSGYFRLNYLFGQREVVRFHENDAPPLSQTPVLRM